MLTEKIIFFLKRHVHFIVLFAAVAVHFWYVIFNFSSALYGGPGDHTAGLIWLYETDPNTPWWSHSESSAAPFGEDLWNPAYIFSQLIYILFWIAAKIAGGGIAGYNLITIGGFVTSYLAVFYLGRRMVNSPKLLTAFVAYLVSFTPFVLFLNAVGHLSYIIAPAYVVALLYCTHQLMIVGADKRRNSILIGLLIGCAWLIDPYFVLFGALALAGIILGILSTGDRKNRFRSDTHRYLILSAAIGILMYLPLLGYAYANSSAVASNVLSVRADIKQDAYQYSARLKDYILPSASNPLIPDKIRKIKAESFHGNDPTFTLYGGILIYLFIAGGLALYFFRSRKEGKNEFKNLRLAFVCIVAAGILFVFSLPPVIEVASLKIWGPNSLIIGVTGIWRVFSRLFIFFYPLIGIAFLVVAAWVLRRYSHRFEFMYFSIVLLLSLTTLSMIPRNPFDGSNYWSVQTDLPSTYNIIKRDKRTSILVEYPLREAPHYKGSMFFSAQMYHEKPLFNSSQTFTETSYIRQALSDLSNPQTIPALKYLGVNTVQVWNNKPSDISTVDTQNLVMISENDFSSMFGKDSVELYKVTDQLRPWRYIVKLDWDSRVWNDDISDIGQKLPVRHSMSVVDLCTFIEKTCRDEVKEFEVAFDIENTSKYAKTIEFTVDSVKRRATINPGSNTLRYNINNGTIGFEVLGEEASDSMIIKNYYVNIDDR